jgi:hypothetical protein
MSLRSIVIAGLFLLPILTSAKPPPHSPTRAVQMLPDRHALRDHLRSLGYKGTAESIVEQPRAMRRGAAPSRISPHPSRSMVSTIHSPW